MPWSMAEKALEDLRGYLFETHAHTGQLTQAVIAANSKAGPPPLVEIILPFARPADQGPAPISQAAARDFLSQSRRGRVPSWAVALTSQKGLLSRLRAAEK